MPRPSLLAQTKTLPLNSDKDVVAGQIPSMPSGFPAEAGRRKIELSKTESAVPEDPPAESPPAPWNPLPAGQLARGG